MENKEIMLKARESLKGHWGIAIGAVLLHAVLVYGIQVVPVAGLIVSLLIGGAMVLGLNTIMLSLARSEETNIRHLFDGFSRFGTALALLLLQSLFVLLWMLLLIIPGLIAAYSYAMTFYILADDKSISAMDAIRKSKQMMAGNKWKLLCLSFRFFGWMLLAILTLGIGLIWLMPYMSVSFAIFYNDIKNTQPQETFLA